jgi:hypothetical protein
MVQRHVHFADGGQPFGMHQIALGGRQRVPQRPVAADPFDDLGQQFAQRGVLDQVVLRARPEGAGGQRFAAVRGDDDDGGSGRPGANGRDQLETGGVGEVIIEQHQVVMRGCRQRLGTGGRGAGHRPAALRHQRGQEPGSGGIVIDDEYLQVARLRHG